MKIYRHDNKKYNTTSPGLFFVREEYSAFFFVCFVFLVFFFLFPCMMGATNTETEKKGRKNMVRMKMMNQRDWLQ
jgi:hypothetical protein